MCYFEVSIKNEKRGALMGEQQHGIMKSWQYTLCLHITDLVPPTSE